MNEYLLLKLSKIIENYESIQKELNSNEISTEKRIELSKKFASIEQIVKKKNELDQIEKNLIETQDMLKEKLDDELIELAKEDIEKLRISHENGQTNLKVVNSKDKDDERNAIVEIRAGTGGDEAALFSMALLKMYQKYGESNQWKFEILSFQETNIGGCKEAILSFSGKNVFLL